MQAPTVSAIATASTQLVIIGICLRCWHGWHAKRPWMFYSSLAGIAGIDPTQGTLGSAAWSRYLIDWGIQWEIDPSDMPAGWTTGYLGINTKSPDEKPPLG